MNPNAILFLLAGLPLAGTAPAQGRPLPVPPARPSTLDLPWPTDCVLTDVAADGAVWAATAAWKAGFAADGATFVPFLGSDAAAASATFALRDVRCGSTALPVSGAMPRLDGQRVVYDRAVVQEFYLLRQQGIEQQFLFASLPERGELRLDVHVATPLAHAADGRGHAFTGEHGGVRYGEALAIDADGRMLLLTTTWTGEALRLTVPAEFVRGARLPLLVDPLIGPIVNLASNQNVALSSPDLAWDQSLQRYFAVYERAYGASDHDIYVVPMDEALQPQGLVVIDISTANWTRPRIAVLEAHDRVGVVAQVGAGGALPYAVHMRTFLAGPTPVLAPAFALASHPNLNRWAPDIGGDARLVGAQRFLVAWEAQEIASNATTPSVRLVDANDVASQITTLNGGISFSRRLVVSKTCGDLGNGTIGWAAVRRAEYVGQSTGKLVGCFVDTNGLIIGPLPGSQVDLTGLVGNDGSEWDVSPPTKVGNGRAALCVERRVDPATGRGVIHGHVFDRSSQTPTSAPLFGGSVDRRHPAVDSDGIRWAVAHAVDYSATDADVRCHTLAWVGGQLVVQDSAVVSLALDRDDQPAVCARTGAPNTYGLSWIHQAGSWSVQAQVYRGTASPSVAVRATGCGGISIGYAGQLALGETFIANIAHQSGIGLFALGTPVANALPGCGGCVQGADGLLVVGSPIAIPAPPNPSLVGIVLAVQGVRYDDTLGPCLGALAFSDTLDVKVH
jgi:hypothetical protein